WTIRESEPRAASPEPRAPRAPILRDVTNAVALPYIHHENDFVDFDREPLIPKLLSTDGPMLAVADVNGDGLDDMFIGGAKGQAGKLLIQQPDGRFVSTNERLFDADAGSEDIGAVFHDAGGGKLVRVKTPGLEHSEGWWNRIVAGDFTGHGRVDFIVGNLGLNTRFQASEAEPVTMYVKDFDRSGVSKQILSVYNHGTSYPIAMRDELIRALPYLKPRYPRYQDYAGQTVTDIFSAAGLAGATVKQAH